MTLDEEAANFREQRQRLGWSAAQTAIKIVEVARARGDDLSLTQQAVSKFEMGGMKSRPRWLPLAQRAFMVATSEAMPIEAHMAAQLDLVPIASIDLEYGLGATFVDGHVEAAVMQFPRQWVEGFTRTPSNLLTFARGRGDSMMPTIHSNDMVMIDRSQRVIAETDAIWAYSVGDIGGIKRLRPRGNRIIILSDNPAVPADEALAEEVTIVGRVIMIIRSISWSASDRAVHPRMP